MIQGQNTSIGTHVYGLGVKNSASVIRGRYGNFYHSYQNALSQPIPAPKSAQLSTILDLPATEYVLVQATQSDAEDFWSTLKQAVHVGATVGQTVLSVGTPFLGPVGAPITAIVGSALSFAGKLTESSMGTKSALDVDHSYKERTFRAIFSKAALQTVLKMEASKASHYKLFEHMESTYHQQKPFVASLEPSEANARWLRPPASFNRTWKHSVTVLLSAMLLCRRS